MAVNEPIKRVEGYAGFILTLVVSAITVAVAWGGMQARLDADAVRITTLERDDRESGVTLVEVRRDVKWIREKLTK